MKTQCKFLFFLVLIVSGSVFAQQKKKTAVDIRKDYLRVKIIQTQNQIDNSLQKIEKNEYTKNKNILHYEKQLLIRSKSSKKRILNKYDSIYSNYKKLEKIYLDNKTYYAGVDDKQVLNSNLEALTNLNLKLNKYKKRLNNKFLPIGIIQKEIDIINNTYSLKNQKENTNLENFKSQLVSYKDSLFYLFKNKYPKRRKKTIPSDLGTIVLKQNPIKSTFRITSKYGSRIHPIKKYRHFHNGIDIVSNSNDVYAVSGGVVKKVSYDSKIGTYIEVEHTDGYSSIYGHLSKFNVLEGDIIDLNVPIAKIGNTGNSTSDHLHFIIKKNKNYINPISLLN